MLCLTILRNTSIIVNKYASVNAYLEAAAEDGEPDAALEAPSSRLPLSVPGICCTSAPLSLIHI